jgi:hypothetical protein
MAEITEIRTKIDANPRLVRADDLTAEISRLIGDQAIAQIYQTRIRPLRTRRYELKAPNQKVVVAILHTLLGIELKIGRRRILCPDLATARYLSVFARLGIPEVAVPYDITQISRLADDLESAWYRLLTLTEHLTTGRSPQLRSKVVRQLINEQREEINRIGAGPSIPQFNQNTKQRRPR